MKIVFFGTSNVALPVLEMLHQHHDIAVVVTQPDSIVGRKKELQESPVSVLGSEMELKVFKPETVKGNNLLRLELENLQADIFIVVSYGKILPLDIINIPRLKTLNIHFSLLPKYRGASPIQFALLNGDSVTGTSIFILDEGMDTGPVLTTETYPIDPDDNFITLSQKLAHASANLLKIVIPDYSMGKLLPSPQDQANATYTKIISKQDGRIDWTKTAQEIYNQFRAFYPWPGIWTVWNGKTVKVTDCLPVAGSENVLPPGTVRVDGCIACGSGTYLQVNRLQLEGKTETDMKSFLNGYRDFIRSKLE